MEVARRTTLCYFFEKPFRQNRSFGVSVWCLLCAVRLGTGISVEHYVAGYLRPAAPGGAGPDAADEGKEIYPVHPDTVSVHFRKLLHRLLYLHFCAAAVYLL